MSRSDPYNPTGPSHGTAAGGPGGLQSPDFQQLVALLGNLMPLLLRFQLQVEPTFQEGVSQTILHGPMLDHQAAVSLADDMIGGSLQTVSGYLDANAGKNVGLNNCLPIVAEAKQSLAARNYAQALNLTWMIYRAITTMRAADPKLPQLRGASPDPATSVH